MKLNKLSQKDIQEIVRRELKINSYYDNGWSNKLVGKFCELGMAIALKKVHKFKELEGGKKRWKQQKNKVRY